MYGRVQLYESMLFSDKRTLRRVEDGRKKWRSQGSLFDIDE